MTLTLTLTQVTLPDVLVPLAPLELGWHLDEFDLPGAPAHGEGLSTLRTAIEEAIALTPTPHPRH